jgi:mono/diheme cytochrome c family protein
MSRLLLLPGVAALLAALPVGRAAPPAPRAGTRPTVSYARDVLPILSANCFTCHGPDPKTRKAKLRLDLPEALTRKLRGGGHALVPGDPGKSEAIARVFSAGRDQMPPRKSGRKLTDEQKQTLKRWVEEGAHYQVHWAFVPPRRPPVPAPRNASWARNPIDSFVLARLEKEGLAPSPEADRPTLARRVALDLTGLPPDLQLVDSFVTDTRPDAYEKFVDRVLASPAYGEHMARAWLDLARYADSNGYADDQPRVIWRYRDWVIEALNANKPFDTFTAEQIAGDLLPHPTTDQLLATAFHRNTLTNDEGGTNDEEFRVAAVVDRVNTTFQVWMGLTMACAQCHDHKYDPLRQEEYFRVFAVFNQTEDNDQPDNRPLLETPTPKQRRERARLSARIAELEKKLRQPDPEREKAQARWEKEVKPDKLPPNVKAALAVERGKRTPAQRDELARYFQSVTPPWKATRDEIAKLQKQLQAIKVVTTPIMRELPPDKRRKTHIFRRGNFLDIDREVTPGVPALFRPLPADRPPDRLALARWLMAPENPLTARVAVNRHWEQLFGQGLVETPDDWGVRGKPPSHPELLDWLAVEFRESGWDVKRLLKLIVTSATYRQSSRVRPELLERDPDNKLLARGPCFRAPAEVVRDQALHAGGLLSARMYGPPVRPPRPKLGLNAAFGGSTDWDPSPGEDRYRRGLYTEWRRTTPYPSMVTFDAPSRTVCTIRRPRTNTPLQALVTLNDPCYVEAAQALARRMVKEGGNSPEGIVRHGFRLCLTRHPREPELRRLVELYHKARAHYSAAPKEAAQTATVPLGPLPPGMDVVDLAAWTVVGNVLLNLDETLARR